MLGFGPAVVVGCIAATTALVLGSAPAHATVTSVTVGAPGLSAKYGTGCSYEVVAQVDNNGQAVEFWENNAFLGVVQANAATGTATFKWTPTGLEPTVKLFAAQPNGNGVFKESLPVQVGKGTNLGSSCLVN